MSIDISIGWAATQQDLTAKGGKRSAKAQRRNDAITAVWRWWARGYDLKGAKMVFYASAFAGVAFGIATVASIAIHG